MNGEPRQSSAKAQPFRRAAVLFVWLMAIWLTWSGHYTPLMIFLGALSCVGVTAVALRMGIVDREGFPHHLGWRLFHYTPFLVEQILLANFTVARHILSATFPISPTLVRIKAETHGELGATILANSITLTPGTISILVHDNSILVHALSEAVARDLQAGAMNRRVATLEGTRPSNPPS